MAPKALISFSIICGEAVPSGKVISAAAYLSAIFLEEPPSVGRVKINNNNLENS